MIRIGLLILTLLLSGCATLSVDTDSEYSQISKQREFTVILKKDSQGNFITHVPKEVKISRSKRSMLDMAAKMHLDTLPSPNPGDVLIEHVRFEEWVGMKDLLSDKQIHNAHNGKAILKRFMENRLVGEWMFGSNKYYMPPITGEIYFRRERDNSFDFTLAQDTLPSHVPKTNKVVVRVSKEKLRTFESQKLLELYKPGVKINCEGFLSREGNAIIIDAQGTLSIDSKSFRGPKWIRQSKINLGFPVKFIYPEPEYPDGKTRVGPIEVVD